MLSNSERSQPAAAAFGFPSPAADDLNITTPGVEQSSLAVALSSPQWPIDILAGDSGAMLAPEPDAVKPQHAVTPVQELSQPPLSFDAVVGADVDPAPSAALVLPSLLKAGPALRLPSFMSLGIAAPHSASAPQLHPAQEHMSGVDSLRHLPHSFDPETFASSSSSSSDVFTSDDLHSRLEGLQQAESPNIHSILPVHSPLHHYVATLTPPDDNGRITWESITKVATGPLNSPSAESGMPLIDVGEAAPNAVVSPIATAAAAAANVTATATAFSAPAVSEDGTSIDTSSGSSEDDVASTWLRPVLQSMLENINTTERTVPIKVLSHALPTPSVGGHVFPTIIESLQNETPTSPMCWINVFHALPGKFNLADLPSSPPSTPGPSMGGDDYFTAKIFDSAVRVLDYQENLQTMPQSPSPIVPPSSVDVSIVERYIPPSSANEFSEMFNVKGPSILIDRLVELSPCNGTLIFIYPTKKGAKTFTQEYLGPILEPLLRSIVVVNGFSADMGSSAGKMAAAAALPDHDIMRLRIQNLCASLSQTSPRMEKFHRKQATFSLVYAAKEEVQLSRKVWAEDWWCKQEKPRLRETINRYFRRANRASEEKTPPMIIQELLDGVAKNSYKNGEPESGIEVSVFVIKRSG